MPDAHPRVAHFTPYILGDSLAAIGRAKKLGYRYIDQNVQCTKDGWPVIAHWPGFVRNGYKWRATGAHDGKGREIRVKASERQLIHRHTLEQVMRFRTARFGGRRPYRAEEHMRRAAALDMVLCLEVKNSPGFLEPLVYKRLHKAAARTRAKVIVMTLQHLGGERNALRRLKLASAAGFPTALLPRRPKPTRWSQDWAPMGVKVWGRWRRR